MSEFKEINVNGRISVGEDISKEYCYISVADMKGYDEGVCWIEPRDIDGVILALKQFQEYKRWKG